jgi:Electron transfer DM13
VRSARRAQRQAGGNPPKGPLKKLALIASHLIVGVLGFAAGVYFLPILIAPSAPSSAEVGSAAQGAQFTTEFRKNLKGSDFLHWGEGKVALDRKMIAFSGKLAPGPDYKLYLSPQFVETKEEFLRLKPRAARVADVKTFDRFIIALPDRTDVTHYNTVVIWCETFSMFITAGKYR